MKTSLQSTETGHPNSHEADEKETSSNTQYNDAFNDLASEVSDLRDELKATSYRVYELIAIFAALFSFITFEAQIFKGPLSSMTLVGVSLIFAALLFIFVILIHYVLTDNLKNLFKNVLFWISIVLAVTGMAFSIRGYDLDREMYWNKDEYTNTINDFYSQESDRYLILEKDIRYLKQDDSLERFKKCISKLGLHNCLD